ncbi:tetratricopeptide repeat protein [Leptospira sp. GIMC2001]|uniref:tetratricopeptide repeat protein n=1 Tax=Leptospira sp. GIMC2001 TaxID=1513297 RepID=UPI00234A8ABF|nr:tetratricopeptide repeat protein [Leptospira sp. GIMC2001]WCL50338.1 tetratricopeptide repeat protein [Leptospira sp. GIMC2001]
MEKAIEAFNKGNYAHALILLDKLIQKNPDDPIPYYHFALSCYHTGNFKKAITVLRDLMDRFPRFIELDRCYKILILSLIQMKNWEAALIELESRLNISPRDLTLLSLKAHVFEKQSQFEESIAIHRKILSFDSNYANSLNNLGYLIIKKSVNPSKEDMVEAMAALKKAVQISPNNPAFLDSLGTLLEKSGNKQSAILALEKAVSFAPDHSELLDHLADLRKQT